MAVRFSKSLLELEGGAATGRGAQGMLWQGHANLLRMPFGRGREETWRETRGGPVDSEWPNALQSSCRVVWLSG